VEGVKEGPGRIKVGDRIVIARYEKNVENGIHWSRTYEKSDIDEP